MSLERWFYLLQYVTLGLSCTALVLAEEPFLPELRFCLAPVLALLLMAWWVEGRWFLPNWGANILGLLIGAAGIYWLAKHWSNHDFALAHLPFHLALLPYMGPLAMATLLVKVFRERDANHFWHVQGLGLMQIGLGCVFDGGPDFGIAMTAYLAGALACLALHYRLSIRRSGSVSSRAGQALHPVTSFHPAANAAGSPYPAANAAGSPYPAAYAAGSPYPAAYAAGSPRPSPRATRRWLFSFTLSWTLLIWVMSLVLFLLTPRRDSWAWQPLNKISSGYSRGRSPNDSDEMNLNGIGRIELDDEIAFHVSADAAGKPKMDLPADQRWRGSVLDAYRGGKWTVKQLAPLMPLYLKPPPILAQPALPNFGADQFFLSFKVQLRRAGGLALAEPIHFGSREGARLPVVSMPIETRYRWFAEISGTVLPQVFDTKREYNYRQVMRGRVDPYRVAVKAIWLGNELKDLRTLPKELREHVHEWTMDLLRRLPEHPRYFLPPALRSALAKQGDDLRIERYYWEVVARALTNYLAYSGEYTYSLQMTRHDRSIDPVLDFLINVKQGHCERYAAALAVMLRSIDIPARVIKGFRGCDSLGNGEYVVRHSHAHAWVEILVLRDVKGGLAPSASRNGFQTEGPQLYDWLTLDATPPALAAAADVTSFNYIWDKVHRFFMQSWRGLIVEYNGDEQAELWDALKLTRPLLGVLKQLIVVASVLVAVVAVWTIIRSLRRPRRRASAVNGEVPIYSRLLRILGRYAALRPAFAQTPREYGEEARTLLQARPAWAAVAELPMRVVEIFYRVRFGGRPLEVEERRQLDAELDRFTQKLRS